MLTTNLLDTLLARFLAGERHLLNDIARLGEPAMRFWIERVLVRRRGSRFSPIEHSEIFQRVYLQLWKRGRQSVQSPVRNPTGYLRRMVQNTVVDLLRKPSLDDAPCHTLTCTTAAVETLPSNDPFPEEIVALGEELERLRQAMTRQERRVWDLLSRGCSWVEVARRLGVSRRVARARFRRLVARLRHHVRASGRPRSVKRTQRQTPAMSHGRSVRKR